MPDAATGFPVVARVLPGKPAALAGMQPYDIVRKINGKDVKTPEDLTHWVRRASPGSELKLEVVRGGKALTLRLKPTELAQRSG
jgi:serine protease Do